MPVAPSNGLEICYETIGNPDDPALLLVMGFSAQLIHWDDAFCQALADRGRYVIRFDNRDCGLSTHLDGVPVNIMGVLAAYESQGEMPEVPYTIGAFADDAFGLLDHLGIDQAHLFGASMGGMIVQAMAIAHPERTISLVSVMSSTGEPEYSQSSPAALAALMTPPPTEREAFIERGVELGALVCSPRYYDKARAAAVAAAGFDRAFYVEGAVRQMAAVRASGDRADGLRALNVPTLVIHGRADPLILPVGGERTAELIPGANLLMLNDMGHDLPQPLWPLIIDATISHTAHRIGGAA
jgi:pimeloyl-ACP methyl ester carboxylesterase